MYKGNAIRGIKELDMTEWLSIAQSHLKLKNKIHKPIHHFWLFALILFH